jgi:hypothetical protein
MRWWRAGAGWAASGPESRPRKKQEKWFSEPFGAAILREQPRQRSDFCRGFHKQKTPLGGAALQASGICLCGVRGFGTEHSRLEGIDANAGHDDQCDHPVNDLVAFGFRFFGVMELANTVAHAVLLDRPPGAAC